jgi:hypothetical protein
MTEQEAVNRDKVLNAIGQGYMKMSKGTAKGYMVLIEDEVVEDKSKLSVLVFNMTEEEFLSGTIMMMDDMISNVMESEND